MVVVGPRIQANNSHSLVHVIIHTPRTPLAQRLRGGSGVNDSADKDGVSELTRSGEERREGGGEVTGGPPGPRTD